MRDQAVSLYVGLDVHKDSVDIALAQPGRDGEVRHFGTVAGNVEAVSKALRRLVAAGERLHVVYEAGPCGFVLQRHLAALGYACEVAAPSRTPRRSGDRIKTDRRDAVMLARLSRAGELTAVRVPDACDEALRDLVRARVEHVFAVVKRLWGNTRGALLPAAQGRHAFVALGLANIHLARAGPGMNAPEMDAKRGCGAAMVTIGQQFASKSVGRTRSIPCCGITGYRLVEISNLFSVALFPALRRNAPLRRLTHDRCD
jgi:transposase